MAEVSNRGLAAAAAGAALAVALAFAGSSDSVESSDQKQQVAAPATKSR